MKIQTILKITTLLTFSLFIMFPTGSRADAIYDAVSLVELNLVGVTNGSGSPGSIPNELLITGNAFVVDEDSIIDKNASADRFAGATVLGNPIGLSLTDGLSQQAVATGEAKLGTAASFALTQGILSINNLSLTETYTIDFQTVFSYLVDTSVGNSNFKFATAVSEIFLGSDLNGSLLDHTVTSDSDLGGGLFTDNAVLPFSISLGPGDSDNLSLTVNAAGIATAATPVPEPSTFGLFAIGLFGVALYQWRQKYSQAGLPTQSIYSNRINHP